MSGPGLSALVVAHNEEEHLPDCLARLTFADEIVVVLDRCTDRSRDIAAAAGARLIEGGWEVEGPRRHAGIDACAHDWILEVDADERVTPELAAEIRVAIADDAEAHYLIPFQNYVGARWVRYGWGAYNGVNRTTRLFRRGLKTWGDQRIHPKVTLRGEARSLECAMIHYVDKDIDDMFERLNRYTNRFAAQLIADGEMPGLAKSLRRFVTRFFKVYVGRKGYREGAYGLALGLFAALYPLLTYIKCRTWADRGGAGK